MAINKVIINKTGGNLAKPLPSEDYISGLVFYAPLAISQDIIGNHVFASLAEAEQASIRYTSTDSPSVGEASVNVLWYHIAEYFRVAGAGKLYVSVIQGGENVQFDGQFNAIMDLQSYAEGSIRQFGIYAPATDWATSHVGNLQARSLDLDTAETPAVMLYAPKIPSNIANLADLKDLNANRVAVCIGEDGSGRGKALRTQTSNPVTCIGSVLGTLASSKTSESIAYVEKYNLVTTSYPGQTISELDNPALSNGILFNSLSNTVLNTLNDKGYIFLIKRTGIAGTYFNHDYTCSSQTDDYNSLHANRVMDKSIRAVRQVVVPKLSTPVALTQDGKLEKGFVDYMEAIISQRLQEIVDSDELSAYKVEIDPEQPVLSTEKLNINIQLVPIGIANHIEVTMGYTLKIQ